MTREWYEARRAQLTANSSGALQRVWFDPLSKKKFYSENTYQAYTRSKKYQELVKKSGQPAPAAIVTVRRLWEEADAGAQAASQVQRPAPGPGVTAAQGFTVKSAVRGGTRGRQEEDEEEGDGEESGSEWETASEEEMSTEGAEQQWEEWDVRRSLFDNHMSPSMEENLEYMWRKFGFYLPDSEYLVDPEGLIKYLVS